LKLAMAWLAGGEEDVVEAQLAYHLNAGVDLVLAGGSGLMGAPAVRDVLARGGHSDVSSDPGAAGEAEWLAGAALQAAVGGGAGWVLPCGPHEFWWPRGDGLKETLAYVPDRYSIVQGLVRSFVDGGDPSRSLPERFSVRRALRSPESDGSPESLLRPIYRGRALARAGAVQPGVLVPLRAWYPVEVFRLPTVRKQAQSQASEEEIERGLAEGSLVVDTRLREALETLRTAEPGDDLHYALPSDGVSRLAFPRPDVVDDAAYAIECAAVGEVNLEQFERRLDELEAQLDRLERTFWKRVRSRLSLLATASPRRRRSSSS
jgi:hypothetical protein